MTESRLVAAPASALYVDPSVAQASTKGYTHGEMREIAATIPAVYDRMGQGWSEGDFNAARWSADPKERQIGDTYHRLWQNTDVSQSLHAHYDGRALAVDSGNHRIRAAQEIGVPVVPVWVEASDQSELDRIEAACDQLSRDEGSLHYTQVHQQHEADRTAPRLNGERSGGRSDPERLHDPSLDDLARESARAGGQQRLQQGWDQRSNRFEYRNERSR